MKLVKLMLFILDLTVQDGKQGSISGGGEINKFVFLFKYLDPKYLYETKIWV